jgi:predicted transcriptional regulator
MMKEQSQQKKSQEKGTFGVYLDLLQNNKGAGPGKQEKQEDKLMQLLNTLSEDEEKPLVDVASSCDMPVSEFASSLETLQSLDMITVQKRGDAKVVRLTSGGAEYLTSRKKEK